MKNKQKPKVTTIMVPPINIPNASWAEDKELVLDELCEGFRGFILAKMEGDEFTQ